MGAVFEWVAGTKIKAPEFIANLGLEWVLRLIQEPKDYLGVTLSTIRCFYI